MINGYPTEEELRNRILRQLEWRDSSDTVALIWHGYLAALLEWGVIEVPIFERLSVILPSVGEKSWWNYHWMNQLLLIRSGIDRSRKV